jgi:hypothetical protein
MLLLNVNIGPATQGSKVVDTRGMTMEDLKLRVIMPDRGHRFKRYAAYFAAFARSYWRVWSVIIMALTCSFRVRLVRSATPFCCGVYGHAGSKVIPSAAQKGINLGVQELRTPVAPNVTPGTRTGLAATRGRLDNQPAPMKRVREVLLGDDIKDLDSRTSNISHDL